MTKWVAQDLISVNFLRNSKMGEISKKNKQTWFACLLACFFVNFMDNSQLEVLGGARRCSEVLGGCSEVLGGCSEVLGGCSEVARRCSEVARRLLGGS